MGSKCSPLNQNTKNMNHYYVDTIKRKSVELPPGTPIRKSKSNSAKKSTIKTNAKQPEMDDQKDLELDVPNRKVINPDLRKRSPDKILIILLIVIMRILLLIILILILINQIIIIQII